MCLIHSWKPLDFFSSQIYFEQEILLNKWSKISKTQKQEIFFLNKFFGLHVLLSLKENPTIDSYVYYNLENLIECYIVACYIKIKLLIDPKLPVEIKKTDYFQHGVYVQHEKGHGTNR